MLVYLLENPSDDRVELAIGLIKECGQKLCQICPRGLDFVFTLLRFLLHEPSLDKPTLCMITILFVLRTGHFKAYPPIPSGLDLVNIK
jgi:pre-mRNA-splicing factor CWC22